jgi:hypothetical protein
MRYDPWSEHERFQDSSLHILLAAHDVTPSVHCCHHKSKENGTLPDLARFGSESLGDNCTEADAYEQHVISLNWYRWSRTWILSHLTDGGCTSFASQMQEKNGEARRRKFENEMPSIATDDQELLPQHCPNQGAMQPTIWKNSLHQIYSKVSGTPQFIVKEAYWGPCPWNPFALRDSAAKECFQKL